MKRRKTNWIGHILRRNCLLKRVTEGKIEGMGRWGRISKQLLDDLNEKRGYWKLKGEALSRTRRRTGSRRSYGPEVRQTTEWINEWWTNYKRTQCCLYNAKCRYDEGGLRRGLEGSGLGLFEIISSHFLGGTEGNKAVPQPVYSVTFIYLNSYSLSSDAASAWDWELLMTHFKVQPTFWHLLERTEEHHDNQSGWFMSRQKLKWWTSWTKAYRVFLFSAPTCFILPEASESRMATLHPIVFETVSHDACRSFSLHCRPQSTAVTFNFALPLQEKNNLMFQRGWITLIFSIKIYVW